MSFADDTKRLEQSFCTTRDLLQQLLKALEQRRAAWVSVRPDVLAPSSEIEQLSQALACQEDLRIDLLKSIRSALPPPLAGDPEKLHVNITRIAAAMSRDRGRALREVADAVRSLARLVRTEVTLGQRLLRFAQRAQHDVDAQLAGLAKATEVPRYDRQARNVQTRGSSGQLVDGRM